MRLILFLVILFNASQAAAGVFKCTDQDGKTSYQTTPCPETTNAAQINPETGTATKLVPVKTLHEQEKQQQQAEEMARQLAQLQKQQLAQETLTESLKNQQLIKNHPGQYSAFAIPPYAGDKAPAFAKNYSQRLPEIERLRRKAAITALAGEKCGRVESVELNQRSKADNLLILVDCSSGASFYFNERQLSVQP